MEVPKAVWTSILAGLGVMIFCALIVFGWRDFNSSFRCKVGRPVEPSGFRMCAFDEGVWCKDGSGDYVSCRDTQPKPH